MSGNRYAPIRPSGREDAAVYAYEELLDLSRALAEAVDLLALQVRHVAPNKPRDGFVVCADGTDWDPGSGAGFYGYYGAAWHKLG